MWIILEVALVLLSSFVVLVYIYALTRVIAHAWFRTKAEWYPPVMPDTTLEGDQSDG